MPPALHQAAECLEAGKTKGSLEDGIKPRVAEEKVIFLSSVCFQGTMSVRRRVYSIVAPLRVPPKNAFGISFRTTMIKVFGGNSMSLARVICVL